MPFNILELVRTGENVVGDAGANFASFEINASGNTRIYLWLMGGHDDPTDRLTAILLVTSAGNVSPIVVAEPKILTNGANDKVFIARPIIVPPSANIDIRVDAISTAAQVNGSAAYIEVPLGQTISEMF